MMLVISGPMGAGKTTAAAIATELVPDWVYVKFAKPIYDILHVLNQPKHRKFMQEVSDVAKRHFGEDIFAQLCAAELKKQLKNGKFPIVDDLRFLLEWDTLCNVFDRKEVLHLHVTAPQYVRRERLGYLFQNEGHRSEVQAEQLAHVADHVIVNEGTMEQFEHEVKQWLRSMV